MPRYEQNKRFREGWVLSVVHPNHVHTLLAVGNEWANEPKPDIASTFTPGRRFYVCSARGTVSAGVWELELVDYDEYLDYRHLGLAGAACDAEKIRVIADEVAFDHVGMG